MCLETHNYSLAHLWHEFFLAHLQHQTQLWYSLQNMFNVKNFNSYPGKTASLYRDAPAIGGFRSMVSCVMWLTYQSLRVKIESAWWLLMAWRLCGARSSATTLMTQTALCVSGEPYGAWFYLRVGVMSVLVDLPRTNIALTRYRGQDGSKLIGHVSYVSMGSQVILN